MKPVMRITLKLVLLLSFLTATISVFAQGGHQAIRAGEYRGNAAEKYFSDKGRTKPLFAVKTNLLFDVLSTPNIELEVPVANRVSVMAEYWFPWRTNSFSGSSYRLLYGGVEGRYWFRKKEDRNVLKGHFLGAYVGFGHYDIGRSQGGYMGDLDYYAGLTYGYSFKLNKFLRLETSLGFGAFRTNYQHYANSDSQNALVWQYSGRYLYFGPSKLKVSIVVLFHGKDNNKNNYKRI